MKKRGPSVKFICRLLRSNCLLLMITISNGNRTTYGGNEDFIKVTNFVTQLTL